ncbi:Hypothetical predicted protein [Olea europaea subsp. europaea]|uniref:Uncharacterized protein n=1 Tax=Olea europaea subsp. europaea TaxID=158383 RepID=A0A8S0SG48_OLEEU|nr:Hypothetical predicted protein [Olea europaea subsp. europaea]
MKTKTESEEEKMEVIQRAIKQLMELEDEKFNPSRSSSLLESYAAVDSEDDKSNGGRRRHLLSKLLFQLESLDGIPQKSGELADEEHVHSSKNSERSATANAVGNSTSGITNEDITKELKELKKQNFVTHCLLSALIVLTIAWQLSEVSLILKVKDGLSNPLRSIGRMFNGMFKSRKNGIVQEAAKHVSAKEREIPEPTPLPGLRIPGFPIEDLLGWDSSDDD